jgi:hypothetical protein
MIKFEPIRENDYWIYPIIFFNILFVTVALYASVLQFRGPAVVLGFLGIWFTSNKIQRDYSLARARIHVALTLSAAGFVAWVTYLLTN